MNSANKKFLLLLICLSPIPFLQTLTFPLLEGWDDHIYLLNNIHKLSFNLENIIYWLKTPCEGCYLPLTMFSFIFDYSFFGLNPLIYRLHNLIWHLFAVIACFHIINLFVKNNTIAFFATLFFAIHPQRVESVVWISERKDVLCTAFYLWSVFFFLKANDNNILDKKLYFFSFIFGIFALMSKPMAVSLPFILFILLVAREEKVAKDFVYKTFPFFLVILIFIPIAIVSQDIPKEHLSLFRRTAVVLFNIPWYFYKLFIPLNLSPIYPRIIISFSRILWTCLFYLSFSVLALISFLKLKSKKWNLSCLLFLLCFFISLAPVSGIIPLGAIDYADRYSYIPSVFLIIFISLFLKGFFESKQYAKIILPLIIAYLSFLASITYFYTFSWASYRTVLETAISHEPPPYIAISALADLEYFTGNRLRIPELVKIARERQKGWESEKGLQRLFFKLDILYMQVLYESGRIDEAAKIAKHLQKGKISEFLEKKSDEDNLKFLIKKVLEGEK
ncbi:MAG TPA: hypothetical protein P5105_00470 [Victivallales bacterium]|nr:hypothetical protein [Victivallales bacterium]HRR05731.1 hypothetical protein [Victivallales bacterium]HRR28476.1 hypothetical protein [Victivallales bacterium]HRU00683.1 hypothetical protein [Victivallales bacterium]